MICGYLREHTSAAAQVGGVEGTAATAATVILGLAGLGVLLYLGLNV